MMTIFSTPKPFEGHIGIIQRNALQSWKLLHPNIEIILFGDEPGTADVCAQLGLRHETQVERTLEGTKLVGPIFEAARQLAHYNILCYSNCDILLGEDFLHAVAHISSRMLRFAMVGRRWDIDITESIDFTNKSWGQDQRILVLRDGIQRLYYNIDYFVFTKDLFVDIPSLAIGRVWWDHWLVWKASQEKAPVIDASSVVVAVHQNHDYSYHPEGLNGVWHGEGARHNFEVAGGWKHLHTIEDATHRLTEGGVKKNNFYWLAPSKRFIRRTKNKMQARIRTKMWHPILDLTRSLRHYLGLQGERVAIFRFRKRKTMKRHPLDRWG